MGNGATLWGKKKGSWAKIKFLASFVDYRKNSHFNKHLLSTYHVKGIVSGAGRNIKITLFKELTIY